MYRATQLRFLKVEILLNNAEDEACCDAFVQDRRFYVFT